MTLTTKRYILGASAITLVIASLVLLFGFDDNRSYMLGSGFLRAGLVLGAIWLALPQVMQISQKFSPRWMIAVLAGTLIVIIRPKAFPFVVVVLFAFSALELAGWFLKPFAGKPRGKKSS